MDNRELAGNSLLDLYVTIASLKKNSRTKTPSVNITQDQAFEILQKISFVAGTLGFSLDMTFEDNVVTVLLNDLNGENDE